jgi:hypothetical protein
MESACSIVCVCEREREHYFILFYFCRIFSVNEKNEIFANFRDFFRQFFKNENIHHI